MTDINEDLDEIIRNSLDLRVDEGQAYIHDTDQAIAKIKALVVESLGKDKRPDENMKAKYSVEQWHLLEGYRGSIGGFNQCLEEIRSIFE